MAGAEVTDRDEGDRVLEVLRALFEEQFEISPEALRAEALLGDDLELDSLDGVTLEVELKDRLGIDFAEADYRDVKTFGDLCGLLRERLAGGLLSDSGSGARSTAATPQIASAEGD